MNHKENADLGFSWLFAIQRNKYPGAMLLLYNL